MAAGLAAAPQVTTSDDTQDPAQNGSAPTARSPMNPATAVTRDVVDSPGQPPRARPARRCRFHASKQGCRAGTSCPFRHDDPQPRSSQANSSTPDPLKRALKPNPVPSQRHTERVNAVVDRPVAQAEVRDPRAFQINQIVRRYGAKQELDAAGGPLLRFTMAPSDPDFPFELNWIECAIRIPPGWPDRARPSLKVSNQEMERGYQVNIERGFDIIWSELRQKTLLNAMKMLDKRLEALLSTSKAETITLVANSAPGAAAPDPSPAADQEATADGPGPQSAPTVRPRRPNPPTFERTEAARSKRLAETKSLEHRMGRESAFSREADGQMYQLPLEPRKRSELPADLLYLKGVRLFVPENYDIDPCSVELLGVDGPSSRNVEAAFAFRAHERRDLTLMAHINYLAQHMHTMAIETEHDEPLPAISPPRPASLEERLESLSLSAADKAIADTDKAHVKLIERPPEWDLSRAQDENDDSSGSDLGSEVDSEDLASDDDDAQKADQTSSQPRETGVMVSIPGLELFNIELLEISRLSLTVKCSRCKETTDVHNLKSSTDSDASSHARSYICRKCSLDATVSFRGDLMHAGSSRAGYLDLDNCEPLDILPSNFLPTCANCSTTHASPGVVSTRASSDSLALCRGCHGRMLFKIPQVHFLRVGPSVRLAGALPRKPGKRATESERAKLGIVPGTELPRRGTCPHYRKSFRWFRFSCCEKLYACDRCHDESPEGGSHPQEFANRIVCGWCSREQRYRPEDCGFCGKSMIGKKGRGFWEGGKGTRNPAQMSRKDPRKYKLRKKIKLDQAKAKEKNER